MCAQGEHKPWPADFWLVSFTNPSPLYTSLLPSLLLVNTCRAVHICPQEIRTQDSRDVAMAHCKVCTRLPPSSLVLVTGRGYFAPLKSLNGNSHSGGCTWHLIGPDCHCVLCSCEQGTGRGRTVCRFLRVFVKASCSTHQAEASGGSVSRKQEQGHPSWSAGAKPRNLCQQHCLRVALSCQQ